MKVLLQTQKATGKLSMAGLGVKIYKTDGIGGFYSGLTASILRQMTYTITRFGCYETAKKYMPTDKNAPFYQKVLLAGISGAAGGMMGQPADLVNVRMQNDVKLPFEQRRHYRNALDGLYRIAREEKLSTLFNGGSMAICRAMMMTIGQLAFYDQVTAF
jgi:dicarboxylate transporter 10